MVDNLSNVQLPQDLAVNLYTATGIPVGTQIEIQNIGSSDVSLYSQAASPLINDGLQIIKRGEYMEDGSVGDGESLEFIIQDDLTGLTRMHWTCQGKETEE